MEISPTSKVLFSTIVVLWAAGQPAWAQGSGSSRTSPPRRTRPQTPAEFQHSFWKHITVTSPYHKWERWANKDEDPRPADEPHGPWVKTYANPIAAKNPAQPAHGSILVHEEYDDDQTTLKAVSVMYRVKGSDREHYDWYWLKYTPQGEVLKTPAGRGGKPIAGKVQSCIDCHKQAGAVLVFSNDDAKQAEKPSASADE